MNKFICKSMKAKGTFKRNLCDICKYQSRCIDYDEFKNGHNDDLREASKPEEE